MRISNDVTYQSTPFPKRIQIKIKHEPQYVQDCSQYEIQTAIISAHLPESYPSSLPPLFSMVIKNSPSDNDALANHIGILIEVASQVAQDALQSSDAALFNCVEAMRPILDDFWNSEDSNRPAPLPPSKPSTPPQSHPSSLPSLPSTDQSPLNVFHGEPFTDRKSTFQAHCALITSPKDVNLFLDHLARTIRRFSSATHNVMAYRCCTVHPLNLSSPTQSSASCAFASDYDDDGESAAGQRLLHLLHLLNIHNAVVVVSRWYGGIKLGPDRFKHINNAARDLLVQEGFVCDK